MLSRVAERMYWFGRYVERAENTARLISVNTNLTLDLTRVGYIWESLISITGVEEAFSKRFSNKDERNVVRFLLEDPSGSIRQSIAAARENVRTTREIRDERQISIIVTEQYARPVFPIVDYAFILENGSAVLEGTREDLMDNPDVKAAYFGV